MARDGEGGAVLLSSIIKLKQQIKEIEKDLGIMSLSQAPQTQYTGSLFNEIAASETRLDEMERHILEEEKSAGLSVEKATVVEGPEIIELHEKTGSVSHAAPEQSPETEEIENIRAVVERLKSSVSAAKTVMPTAEKKPAKEDKETPVKTEEKHVLKPAKATAKELPAINTLLSEIEDLIKSNKELSEELKETINETKIVNRSAKLSELVKRLAVASLNG